jgi:DNA (cytosine-5)-methyltransferase 1
MTDEILTTSADKLLKPCKIKAFNSLSQEALSEYTKSSPYHFYCTYYCIKADPFHWRQRKTLTDANKILTTCAVCFAADQDLLKYKEEFLTSRTLHAFDPFGGVGAFALSMEEAKVLQLTHAAEISPSAAETLRYSAVNIHILLLNVS